MNVLLVDDQKTIVDSIKRGVNWKKVGVTEVYTACSTSEAKLILVNFPVNILITDIEMPEDNGLQLFQWAKERMPILEGIFLTAHAEFEYAREAIQMGGFDYILQPVRYIDVEGVVSKACEKIRQSRHNELLAQMHRKVRQQRDVYMDALFSKIAKKQLNDALDILEHMAGLFMEDGRKAIFYSLRLRIMDMCEKEPNDKLNIFVIRNVLEEIFDYADAKVCIKQQGVHGYYIMMITNENKICQKDIKQGIEQFYGFMEDKMNVSLKIYVDSGRTIEDNSIFLLFLEPEDRSLDTIPGIFWECEAEKNPPDDQRMEEIFHYIKNNISRNISRKEMADLLYLNEDYFSHLFKSYTGYSFKEFVLREKIRKSQQLLTCTRLPVSIIASKVGYDNFSHFSRMFKKITGITPREYRNQETDP